jgi:nucleoid DNA-binding protein
MSEDQATVTPTETPEQPQAEEQPTPPRSLTEEILGERPPLEEKEDLYKYVQNYLNAKVEDVVQPVVAKVKDKANLTIKVKRVFSKDDARDILVLLMDGLVEALLFPKPDGTNVPTSLGIPGGFGSFQLGYAKKTRAKTPQKVWVDVPRRWRVKWVPGKQVTDRIKALIPPEPEEEENSENPATG